MRQPEGGERASAEVATPTKSDTTPLAPGGGWGAISSRQLEEVQEPLPRSVGPYRVLRRLGRGGMGEVLLAWDEVLARRVALKRIRPDRQLEAELRRRFEIEARLTALLQHPSIIPIYFYSPDDAYYAMRPVEGLTLAELVVRLRDDEAGNREEWPMGRLVRLFLQAANAVAYAHARGVMHRDLKPSNIMIGPFEEVLVVDWGMAKYAGEEEPALPLANLDELRTETASQTLVGTPAYMAPEQLRNEAADFQSEVFSLGIILYELLSRRLPWRGRTIGELLEAMATPPPDPGLLQPGRNVPTHLGQVVLRALDPDRRRRFPTVRAFSTAVAHALEGRAPWMRVAETEPERWRLAAGRVSADQSVLAFRSRGQDAFRFVCPRPVPGNCKLTFEVRQRRGTELGLWLSASLDAGETPAEGYFLRVLPGRRRTLSLRRSGRVVAGARNPGLEPRRWYRVVGERDQDKISLSIDGTEVYSYRDPIPLLGGFVGLEGRAAGVEVRNLRLFSRGSDARISCLSVPDAFFNRGLYEEAKSEYESIVASHPGRGEGLLALYRAGLCMVEMARREEDEEVRALILGEARENFAQGDSANLSCLTDLGLAIVAQDERRWRELHDRLASAFESHPDDPHLPAVREWILGRLHAPEEVDRRLVAELLPLALAHCMEGWGARVVREQIKLARSVWETPSFLSGRSRLRDNDPVSLGEASLLFSFWAGRADAVEKTFRSLLDDGLLRPHHVSDALFSLLELGAVERAVDLGERMSSRHGGDRDWLAALQISRTAVLAVAGDPEQAEEVLRQPSPRPLARAFNSARLWAARAAAERGDWPGVRRALRRRGPRDYFAREHLAWFALEQGDAERAERELRPLVERGDHERGRNLVNFLHGVRLILAGRSREGQRTFDVLPERRWPRTWTLGSYLGSHRLAGGSIEAYRRHAFPWELQTLEAHRRLLARARGEEPFAG